MMRSFVATVALLAASLAGGCERDPIVLTCDPARGGAECLLDGVPGQCLGTCDDGPHYCAFPAHDCTETQLAFGPLSANYSSVCVEACSLPDGGPADATAVDAGAADAGPADAGAPDAAGADGAP